MEDKDLKVEEVQEQQPDTEDDVKLDWKKAEKQLKKATEKLDIDHYFKWKDGQGLQARYDTGERTQELYDLIMAL